MLAGSDRNGYLQTAYCRLFLCIHGISTTPNCTKFKKVLLTIYEWVMYREKDVIWDHAMQQVIVVALLAGLKVTLLLLPWGGGSCTDSRDDVNL